MRRLLSICLLALAGFALLGPAPASAFPRGPKRVALPRVAFLYAHAPAGNGYRLEMYGSLIESSGNEGEGEGEEGEPPSVASAGLIAHGPDGRVEYAPVDSTFGGGGGVRFDLGRAGEVAMHFVPRRVSHRTARGCDRESTTESGYLKGRFEFEGEAGFAAASRRAIPAILTTQPAMTCRVPTATRQAHEPGSTRIGGSFFRRRRSLYFIAVPHPALGVVTLRGASLLSREGVRIARYAAEEAPTSALSLDLADRVATLQAPPGGVVGGGATFTGFPGKRSGTWLGNLTVDFPGEPGVHLAGHRYQGSWLSGDECAVNPNVTCSSIRFGPQIGLDPVSPTGR